MALQCSLNSQALATFGAACIDDSTATTGLHANEKTVSALAASNGRLKSAFHADSNKELPRRMWRAIMRA